MTLIELGTIVDQKIKLDMTTDGRVVANFPTVEIKETPSSCILSAIAGFGRNRGEALADYAARLCGKWVVVNANAYKANRQEFQLPAVITP